MIIAFLTASFLLIGFHLTEAGGSFDEDFYKSPFCSRDLGSLRQVITVFRHGDRAPIGTFPTDIYRENAWPNGFGHLTHRGMRRMYKLGKWMRQCYGHFLPKFASATRVYVRSSSYPRTLQSAQLVLAGAYPTLETEVEINQTRKVSTDIVPVPCDDLILIGENCPRIDQLEDEMLLSEQAQNVLSKDLEFLKKMARICGFKSKTDLLSVASTVQDVVLIEIEHGLTPIHWLNNEYVIEKLKFYRDFINYITGSNPEMAKILGGNLLWEILQQLISRASHLSSLEHILYSGHVETLDSLLTNLRVWELLGYRPSPYGSIVIFELHELRNGSFAVAIYYRDSSADHPIPLTVFGCGDKSGFCPLEDFKSIVKGKGFQRVPREVLCANRTESFGGWQPWFGQWGR